jgi:hypothetical protein
MITETEIGPLARKLADLWVADDTHALGLSDLNDSREDDDLADAVYSLAQYLFCGSGVDEGTSKSLTRLARATGCPLTEPIIPWLQEHGLIEKVDGHWRFKVAEPESTE